ncbi:MAG: diaminopimelate epimerase, partial [Paraprevotella sp.]|nr:diaminopimelate epimerase [Paraprevotella sp.]
MPYLCSRIKAIRHTEDMNKRIHFTKMHGAGNDYIYVYTPDFPIPDPS